MTDHEANQIAFKKYMEIEIANGANPIHAIQSCVGVVRILARMQRREITENHIEITVTHD